MRILILSDLHLGAAASRAHALLDGIRAIARQYDRVILNGDTLDRYEAAGCEENSEQLIRDVFDACASGSAQPEVLSGNHDPAISSTDWLYLPKSKALVFHGDCVCDGTHPSERADRQLIERLKRHWAAVGGRPENFTELVGQHRKIQAQYLADNPLVRESRNILNYLGGALYPPQKPFHILSYWMRAPRLAAALAATFEQPVRHVVVGHTHLAGKWAIGGLEVLNTGSFMPLSTPHAVSVDGPNIRFLRVRDMLARGRRVTVFQSG